MHRPFEADDAQHLRGALVHRVLVHAAHFKSESDIAQRREPGKQRRLLKHDAAVEPGLFDPLAVEPHLAFDRLHQAGDDAQERAFAAAGGTEQAEEFVARDGDLEILRARRTQPSCPS